MDFIFIENENFQDLFDQLESCTEICLDLETTSKDVFLAKPLLLQLELNDKIYVCNLVRLGNLFFTSICNYLKIHNKLLIGHNIKYDCKVIDLNTGIKLDNLYDTMLAEVLINQGIGKQFYSLEELVLKYFNIALDKSERETFENYENDYFTNSQVTYAALDVKYLKEIKRIQLDALFNQKQINVLNLENGIIKSVYEMELNGVLLDVEHWRNLIQIAEKNSKELELDIKNIIVDNLKITNYPTCLDAALDLKIPIGTKALSSLLSQITYEDEIKSWIKNNININSHVQILRSLNLAGVPVTSTGEKIIKDYKGNQLVDILLRYREYNKRLTTYGENFIELINHKTGRIHVDMNQVGTVTGRFAVSRLQQIPKENVYRRAFISRPGFKLLTADLNQAEFRLIGADSGEPEIINAYLKGFDFHTKTASVIYKKKYEDVTKDERYWGKQANFAIIYRVSKYGLLYNFGLPLDDGEKLLNNLFSGYPTLKNYMDELGEKVWAMGYCPTMYGRRRYFDKPILFVDTNEYRRIQNRAIRELCNHRIQGTCADIIKLAMLDIDKQNPFGDKLRLLMQIHDELVIEIEDSITKDAEEFVRDIMLKAEQPFLGEIPAIVDIKIAVPWTKD